MTARIALRALLLLLSCQLTLPLYRAPLLGQNTPTDKAAAEASKAAPITPGPADGKIAFITARMLESMHYSRQPLDRSIAGKFLDRYLEYLDPQHLHFTAADLQEFEPYRTSLDHLTINNHGEADVRPATEIFNRFMERLEQRVAYVDELLKNEHFTFDTDERITINRHELAYPKDLDEAKQLWRERLRFEYLQEHLGKIGDKKKTSSASRSDSAADPAGSTSAESGKKAVKAKSESEQIVETLTHRYHRNLRAFTDWNHEDVLQAYLTALAHVYDPHSDYMGRAQLESFSIGMNLSLCGIGAELQSDDGYCTIRRLLPGGPAIKSKKIKEKDRIVAVAQSNQPPVDVVDMSLNKAVQLIRGPKGTEVRLTIIPGGEDASASRVLSLIRDEIKLEDQEAKAKVIEVPDSHGENLRLGVIDLPSFYAAFDLGGSRQPQIAGDGGGGRGGGGGKSTTADVGRLLTKLKQEKIGGIILDLRRNGGGSLEEAIKLTGLFIKEGPVVQVREPDGSVQVDDDTDPSVLYDGPLIVLTSRFSASASEILAGALQDYGRALIVGDSSTHGKGTVQSVNSLRALARLPGSLATNEPGALKVTIKKFYRASGASTQLKGVTPDLVLPSIFNDSKDVGEATLENPLPWDTIASAKYEPLNLVAPYLPELRKGSEARLEKDQEFAYIREDIAQYNRLQADKTISLNEQQRLKEKEEADARQRARKKERLARGEPKEIVHELTLRQVDLPGLPEAIEKTNSVVAGISQPKSSAAISAGANASAATVAPAPSSAAGTEDASDEEKAPAVDATLIETEHILVDYMGALAKSGMATTRSNPGKIN